MEGMVRRLILSVVLAAMVLSGGVASAADPARPNIPKMIQESPGFYDHPRSDGIIWLRDLRYSLGADGSMERLTTRVILARKGIDARWTRWEIPVPEKGRVEVLDAGLYDPGSGRLLAPVLPRETVRDGLPVVDILFPDLQEEFIMVFSVREVFPKRLFMDDFVWMYHELPQWEQRVTVDVPQDMPFVIGSSGVGQFKKERVGTVDRYTWSIVNTPAWSDRTLLSDVRGYIAFSMRKGTDALAKKLFDAERAVVPDAPAAVRSLLSKGDREKRISSLMAWLNEAPELADGVAPSLVRNPVPAEGPWTMWEKVLLLNRWAQAPDWQSRILWFSAYTFGDETPATPAAILRPAVEFTAKGSTPVYVDLLQGTFSGETSLSLRGRPLYALGGMKLEPVRVSSGSAEDHRLSIEWRLDLDTAGALSGDVHVFVRKGWADFFFPSGRTDEEMVHRLASELFPSLTSAPGIGAVKPIKYGWQVTFPVVLKQSIVSGGSMLVPYPASYPVWLTESLQQTEEFGLRFPFILEQSFAIKLPPRWAPVMLPFKLERPFGKVRYGESVTMNRTRNTLSGEAKIVLSTSRITPDVVLGLGESIQRWMAFGTKSLPVRSR